MIRFPAWQGLEFPNVRCHPCFVCHPLIFLLGKNKNAPLIKRLKKSTYCVARERPALHHQDGKQASGSTFLLKWCCLFSPLICTPLLDCSPGQHADGEAVAEPLTQWAQLGGVIKQIHSCQTAAVPEHEDVLAPLYWERFSFFLETCIVELSECPY